MKRASIVVATLLAIGCGVEGRGPAPVPLPRSAPPPPRAIVAVAAQDAFFLPDGRVAQPFEHTVRIFDPAHPEEGTLVPFEGTLRVAGKHVFAVPATGDRLVELDAGLRVIHATEGATLPLVAMTDDGEYVAVFRNGKGSLLRTGGGFVPVATGFQVPAGRPWGRLVRSRDGRYVIGARDVVDLEKGTVVFSHSALSESAAVVERGRLHWVFLDLLETVDLATGARARTWLPCRGRSVADLAGATLYTSCATSMARATLADGVPKIDDVPLVGAREVDSPSVDEDGRLVVSVYDRTRDPGVLKQGSAFAMARGGSKLEPMSMLVAGKTRIAPLPAVPAPALPLRLANGAMVPLPPLSSPGLVSPDGTFALVGRSLLSLRTGHQTTLGGASSVATATATVRDGAIVIAKSGGDRAVLHEVRFAPPRAGPTKPVSVTHEPGPAGDPVTRVTIGSGKDAATFTTPILADVGEEWSGGVVLRGEYDAAKRLVYCTRTGKCQELVATRGLVGLGDKLAFRMNFDDGSVAFAALGAENGKESSVDLDATIGGIIADGDTIHVVVEAKPRRLVRISAKEARVTRDVLLDGIAGNLLGAMGSLLAFESKGVVRMYDAETLEPKGAIAFSAAGYVTIREDGTYLAHGDTAEVLPTILCTSGASILPRERCEGRAR